MPQKVALNSLLREKVVFTLSLLRETQLNGTDSASDSNEEWQIDVYWSMRKTNELKQFHYEISVRN